MRKKHKYGLPLVAAFLMQASSFAQTTPLINLVEIPAGSFYMGSEGKGEDYDEDEDDIDNYLDEFYNICDDLRAWITL